MSRVSQSSRRVHQLTAMQRIDSYGKQIANTEFLVSAESGGDTRNKFQDVDRVPEFVPTLDERTTALDENAAITTLPVFWDRNVDADSLPHILEFPQVPVFRAPVATFLALQEWEGYVLEIHETEFRARLVDITADLPNEEEDASIPLAEISEDDARKMKVGSIFRWVIGYERSPMRPKKRVSQIVFRDLPAITRADMRDGEEWAQRVIRTLNR